MDDLKALITILESASQSESKEAIKEGIDKVIAKLKGTTDKTEENGLKDSVIPYKQTPLATEKEKWDASSEVKNATGNSEKLYTMHTYVDRSDDDFDDTESKWYKLPHHKGDGDQSLVWKGLSAAVAAVRGARGGVDIPDTERAGVMAHLRKHYKEFDKEFPEEEDGLESILGLSEDKNTIYRIDNDSNPTIDSNLVRAQVLKIKKLIHRDAKGGVLNVTKESIKKIVKNFKDNVIDNVYVPLGHTNDVKKNTGKVTDLIATDSGLDAVIEIRDKSVLKKLKDKLIEKVSASIDENYLNKETGKFVGPVLRHIALVAEPYIKGMNTDGLVFLEEDEEKNVVVLVEETTIGEDLTTIKDTINNVNFVVERITKKLDKDKKMDKKEETKNVSDEVKKDDEVKEEKSDETKEEKTTEDVKSDEKSEDNSKEDEKSTEEKTSDEKSDKTSTESESKDEATEEETESVDNSEKDKEINLAEAEKEYDELLQAGKVLPVQKNEIVSLLASKGTINLSEGEKSISELVKSLLNKQKSLDFEEKGAENTDKIIVEDANKEAIKDEKISFFKNKMGASDEDAQVAFEEYSKINETKEGMETTG